MTTGERLGRAIRAAQFYRRLGFNPLPSRCDDKRPVICYAGLWETPLPPDLFESAARRHFGEYGGINIQLMTGLRWGLVVVDLDGAEAAEVWPAFGRHDPTWEVANGGPGRHLWFTPPPGLDACPSRSRLWGIPDGVDAHGRATWQKHKAVELLADRKLAIAPPSTHPGHGREYRFLPGRSPREIALPAPLPGWVLDLPNLDAPPPPPPRPARVPLAPAPAPAGTYDARAVYDAIGDKRALAESWGVRVTGRPGGRGALRAHAIGRDDRRPSGLFNPETGRYWDPWVNGGRGVGLFDLALRLGIYESFSDCVNDLGARYGARPN